MPCLEIGKAKGQLKGSQRSRSAKHHLWHLKSSSRYYSEPHSSIQEVSLPCLSSSHLRICVCSVGPAFLSLLCLFFLFTNFYRVPLMSQTVAVGVQRLINPALVLRELIFSVQILSYTVIYGVDKHWYRFPVKCRSTVVEAEKQRCRGSTGDSHMESWSSWSSGINWPGHHFSAAEWVLGWAPSGHLGLGVSGV